MNFPSICVDNFYPDPERVRQFAMSQKYFQSEDGKWPGKRSDLLHEINSDLFNQFSNKLFSIFYDFRHTNVSWEIESTFQLIDSLSDVEDSIKNKGWVHTDEASGVLAGVIYLSPNAKLQTGTSVYTQVDKTKLDMTNVKQKFYLNKTDENYDEILMKHNSGFIETIRYNNVYNRLVMWDGSQWHGVNSYYSPNEPRLTQVFFVRRLEADSNPPLKRFNINI
jgi:hypothetical protein